ncbi:MAG: hypothetical protein JOY96_02790 [Verrucomicrobia bacterium]|nr:hypothetical protein [Verrucomicrobiota bacterium]
MKAKKWMLLAQASAVLTSGLISAEAITFQVHDANGVPRTYSLEVPANTGPAKSTSDPDVAYSSLNRVNAGSAAFIAAAWAAGTTKDTTVSDNYPNSMTDIGGKGASGFYGARNIKVVSVQQETSPTPYYLVQMTGEIGANSETFYAAVLNDGRVIRPTEVTGTQPKAAPRARHRRSRSHE